MSFDGIELKVMRPPLEKEEALKMAEMQYGYCPDILEQGVGTIEALAATLLNGTVWSFWWD